MSDKEKCVYCGRWTYEKINGHAACPVCEEKAIMDRVKKLISSYEGVQDVLCQREADQSI
jgi:hypothetical protein